MSTIRELVAVVRQREGVDAAVVLGRDGVLIDAAAVPLLDAGRVAAFVPAVVRFAQELSNATGQGALRTALLEHDSGVALIMALSDETLLLVIAQQTDSLSALLYELRRNRAGLQALV
ncbi:MAG: roadblock/LC7 domain-containing protein [Gemmatimonadetes bacterium]|jgi:predicted regulator of Ras-like GTPase activity (Roadblock/LC7/MglB family)|nr:roadblock/LC7 domain-containing protein [Gemmatimonadota bacterium]